MVDMNMKIITLVCIVLVLCMIIMNNSKENYPSPDPCSPMTESCYKIIWNNAGCTTDPSTLPGQLGWALKQKGKDLEDDSHLWATLRDSVHTKGCYGAYPMPANYVKPALLPYPSLPMVSASTGASFAAPVLSDTCSNDSECQSCKLNVDVNTSTTYVGITNDKPFCKNGKCTRFVYNSGGQGPRGSCPNGKFFNNGRCLDAGAAPGINMGVMCYK